MKSVPPVHSPLTLRALAGGVRAAVSRRAAGEAEKRVRDSIREEYAPRTAWLLDSGTSALSLAIRAAGHRRPGPAALPAYCCYDVATAAVGARSEIVLYDVDPETLGPDADSLRSALERGVSSVVLVHLYGIPVDLDRFGPAIEAAGAVLIEDAAQGAGGRYRGKPLGAWGSLAVLSFGRGKGRTGGGGGALFANDERGEDLLVTLRTQGLSEEELPAGGAGWDRLAATAAQWALARPGLYTIPASLPFLGLGETVYRSPWPPRRMPRACSGVLAETWGLQTEEAERRRTAAARLREELAREEGVSLVRPPEQSVPGYLRFPVLVGERRIVIDRDHSVDLTAGYPAPIRDLSALRARLVDSPGGFSGSEALCQRLFTIPPGAREDGSPSSRTVVNSTLATRGEQETS